MKLDGLEIQNELLEKLLNNRINRKPTMLVGHAGTGKTLLARRLSFGSILRAPHHTISRVGMVGEKRPGEHELAHNGILFLDEFPEFQRSVLEALSSAIKNKEAKIESPVHREKIPVDAWILGTMNNCACGRPKCLCKDSTNERYLERARTYAQMFGFEFIHIEGYRDESLCFDDTRVFFQIRFSCSDKNI